MLIHSRFRTGPVKEKRNHEQITSCHAVAICRPRGAAVARANVRPRCILYVVTNEPPHLPANFTPPVQWNGNNTVIPVVHALPTGKEVCSVECQVICVFRIRKRRLGKVVVYMCVAVIWTMKRDVFVSKVCSCTRRTCEGNLKEFNERGVGSLYGMMHIHHSAANHISQGQSRLESHPYGRSVLTFTPTCTVRCCLKRWSLFSLATCFLATCFSVLQ